MVNFEFDWVKHSAQADIDQCWHETEKNKEEWNFSWEGEKYEKAYKLAIIHLQGISYTVYSETLQKFAIPPRKNDKIGVENIC